MSGLPVKSPHCVTRTVICGRVLSLQAVHLQIQRVLGVVSGDGESALHGVCVVYATSTTTNICDPLQPLPWSLADPAHPIATEGESRCYTGESQGPPRLHQVSPRLHQLHVTLDTCRHKTSWSGNCHTSTGSHSYPLTYSVPLIHHELPFKRATRKTQPRTNSMVSCLCSVLSLNGNTWDSQAGAPLPAAESVMGWFYQHREGPICMCYDIYITLQT